MRVADYPTQAWLVAPFAHYIATSHEATLDQVRQASHWRPIHLNEHTREDSAYWIRAIVCNNQPQAEVYQINLIDAETAHAYKETAKGEIREYRGGSFVPRSRRSLPDQYYYLPIPLAAGECAQVWLKVAKRQALIPELTPTSPLAHPPRNIKVALRILRSEYANSRQADQASEAGVLETVKQHFQGATLLLTFLAACLFFYSRQPIYGWYAGYLFCFFINSVLNTRPYFDLGRLVGEFPYLRYYAVESIQWLGLGCYCFFVVLFLDLPQDHPPTARFISRMGHVFWISAVFFLILLLLTNDADIKEFYFRASRYLALPVNLALLVWLGYRLKHRLLPFFLLGNFLLALAGIVASLVANKVIAFGQYTGPFWGTIIYEMGILVELILFSLALAYRLQLLDRERVAVQRAYIQQLEANNQLTTQLNVKLEESVDLAKREVADAYQLLEAEREQQIRSGYEKLLAETEMMALRSQMNPHFLFNSLNSIEYFLLSGQTDKAAHYLSRFSKLLRMVLQHSRAQAVSLGEELAALRLYLELESSRFEENFTFFIEENHTADLYHTLLPPMLLQPFAENAILHGLMPSDKTEKQLWIRVLKGNHYLDFEIEDNGIGRARAQEIKSRSTIPRRSYGLAITSERIELFNRNHDQQISMEVNDLPTGTLVRLRYQIPTR